MSLYNIFNNILSSTISSTSSGSSASGDVYGPSSSTADGFAIYNGSTGKIIKNSDITYDQLNQQINCRRIFGTLFNSSEVQTDIITVKTLGGATNLEITNDQGQGIILEPGANGVLNFTGFAYNNATGKYLKLIDQNGKIGVGGPVIDAPINTTINSIARFSNINGQLKNSSVSISDTGRITAPEIDARILPNICDGLLLKGDITPEFKTDIVSIGSANSPIYNIYSNSINCSGLKFNNLVGPGILRIDANGNVYVDIPLITPTNLTSNTSDSNFIVSRSSIKDNNPDNEAYRMFDSSIIHPVWLCGNGQYDWIGGHANGGDNFQGIGGAWFKISLNTAKSWNQYTIQPTFREELLSSWRIYGSNDDINYTLITSQTDYTFPNFTNQNLLTETFTMGYEVSYRYIVFHVTKIRNENNSLRMYFGIREFRFNKV